MKKIKKLFLFLIIFICLILSGHIFAQTSTFDTELKAEITSLQGKVNYLEEINNKIANNVYWILGTFVVIFLGIVGLNTLSNISINRNRLENIKKNLSGLIESKTKEITKVLGNNIKNSEEAFSGKINQSLVDNKSKIEEYKGELVSKIKDQENILRAENSRNMAYNCKNSKNFDLAFVYSLEAAFYFEKMGNVSLPPAWLGEAEEGLIKGSGGDYDAKFFDDNLKDIRDELSGLKGKYCMRVARIERLLELRIEQAKQVSLPLPKA